MKKYLFILMTMTSPRVYYSQTEEEKRMPKNYVYAEFLGSSFFYSINFERNIMNKPAWAINLRAGFGAGANFSSWYTFTGHFIYGRRKDFMELATGATYVQGNDYSYAFPIMLSWRHHFQNHLFIRLGFAAMPLFQKNGLEGMLLWPGGSAGISF